MIIQLSAAPGAGCGGMTDASGVMTCVITPPGPVGLGSLQVGNPQSQTWINVPFVTTPQGFAGSSFVVGDQSAVTGGAVTFWGAQWASQNSLSGGTAPSSFKGYSGVSGSAMSCTSSWTTTPGNSTSPPVTVPSYIGVFVSSSVTKAGSEVSGNVTELAIIKTDPGYAPDPGHPGTGTIVAIVPCA